MEVFHHYNEDHNTTSAKEVVPHILSLCKNSPVSVLDVGCGVGQWLNVFKDHGITKVLGIDGAHVPTTSRLIEDSEFIAKDLREIGNLNLSRKFDLVLNLEVAEHLPPENASDLVNFLVSHGDIIIFSAAIIGQTGENHINEQNPVYWQNLFKEKNYVMLDAFRDHFWNNEKVNWWYRQNLFLVVKSDLIDEFPYSEFQNLYIHPELFLFKESIYDARLAELKKSDSTNSRFSLNRILSRFK